MISSELNLSTCKTVGTGSLVSNLNLSKLITVISDVTWMFDWVTGLSVSLFDQI